MEISCKNKHEKRNFTQKRKEKSREKKQTNKQIAKKQKQLKMIEVKFFLFQFAREKADSCINRSCSN